MSLNSIFTRTVLKIVKHIFGHDFCLELCEIKRSVWKESRLKKELINRNTEQVEQTHTKCPVYLILWCTKHWNRIKLLACAVVLNICWVTVTRVSCVRHQMGISVLFLSVEFLWRATGVSIIFSVLASYMDNNFFSFYLFNLATLLHVSLLFNDIEDTCAC